MEKTLGGDRLGSGKKQKVDLHGYERSTHDLSYIWRSTMSAGTLVPFMKRVALPGDTWDIDLDCHFNTHPTIGPLFGSFKVQLDIFQAPIRLYHGQLHNNKLGIGMKMADVKLPYIDIHALPVPLANITQVDLDNVQINPSCILSYLGMRGVGYTVANDKYRRFNGLALLAYWDIYKNYYANKQEEEGAVIHTPISAASTEVVNVYIDTNNTGVYVAVSSNPAVPTFLQLKTGISRIKVAVNAGQTQDLSQVNLFIKDSSSPQPFPKRLSDIASLITKVGDEYFMQYTYNGYGNTFGEWWAYRSGLYPTVGAIQVTRFPLSDIDDMREQILANAVNNTGFDINASNLLPYDYLFNGIVNSVMAVQFSQEGLAIKTYQSDLFNNWMQTDWIDGVDGIREVTKIDTTGDFFYIDTLLMQRKVYDMLNRIAISGGTYQDWLDAVYTHEAKWNCETPMYLGGLSKELVFQEVVSNSESQGDAGAQPLGTLAGKGILSSKHKGGKVVIKVDEPSYILGIISLTPRIDYSQGNDFDTHFLTMDDLRKPALDQIGFQDLIVEQMAWWTTYSTGPNIEDWKTQSAGKQPSWINYMTSINQVRGNFAIQDNEMFMTLNRKYSPQGLSAPPLSFVEIKDLTTYIDPTKYNNIFAQTSLDSQNFWAQIAIDITYRGKISAKQIPNL